MTLKSVYTQWARTNTAEVWVDQKMFQILRSHDFFPESNELSQNSEKLLKLKVSWFHTSHKPVI